MKIILYHLLNENSDSAKNLTPIKMMMMTTMTMIMMIRMMKMMMMTIMAVTMFVSGWY